MLQDKPYLAFLNSNYVAAWTGNTQFQLIIQIYRYFYGRLLELNTFVVYQDAVS